MRLPLFPEPVGSPSLTPNLFALEAVALDASSTRKLLPQLLPDILGTQTSTGVISQGCFPDPPFPQPPPARQSLSTSFIFSIAIFTSSNASTQRIKLQWVRGVILITEPKTRPAETFSKRQFLHLKSEEVGPGDLEASSWRGIQAGAWHSGKNTGFGSRLTC